MGNELEVKKVDELSVDVNGKVWTLETLEHAIKTNEDELTELSDRGEKLLDENVVLLDIRTKAIEFGVKTVEERAEERAEQDRIAEESALEDKKEE